MVTQGSIARGRAALRAGVLGVAGLVLLSLAGLRWGPTTHEAGASAGGGAQTVVVAARALDAGQILGPADITLREAAGVPANSGAIMAPREAVGRRLLVMLASGSLLTRAVLSTAAPPAGRRAVRITVDTAHLDPGVDAGAEVEVLAAVDGSSTGSRPRVVLVGVAHVTGLRAASNSDLGTPLRTRALSGGDASALSATTLVTLDCDDAEASRVVWAETFARSIRLLVRDGGEADPGRSETGDAAVPSASP